MGNYALIIAVERYADANIPHVLFAEGDARGIAATLKRLQYDPRSVTVILSNAATKATLESAARRHAALLTENDSLFVFYAGHGLANKGRNYITAFDTNPNDAVWTSIRIQWLFDLFRKTHSKHVMFFLDCCHSGFRLTEKSRTFVETMSDDELRQYFKSAEHHVVFAACRMTEFSWPSYQYRHGFWTYHLIRALSGEEPRVISRGRFVTSADLQDYLGSVVPSDVKLQLPEPQAQNPVMFGNVSGTFLIADLAPVLGPTAKEPRSDSIVQTPFRKVRKVAAESSISTTGQALIVDPVSGRGAFTTIKAAIAAAKAGQRVIVKPGVYTEPLILDKSIALIGEGARNAVTVTTGESDTIMLRTQKASIENFTIHQQNDRVSHAVNIHQGKLILNDCCVTSKGLASLVVRGGAFLAARKCRISAGKGSAIYFSKGSGIIENCEIFDGSMVLIEAIGGGKITLLRSRIHAGQEGGLLVDGGSTAMLEFNEFFNLAYPAVEMRGSAEVTLKSSQIHDCRQGAVLCSGGAQGTVEHNDISGNGLTQLEVRDEGYLTICHNRIHDGYKNGILCGDRGNALIEDNEIFGNASSGVEVDGTGYVIMKRNRLYENGYEAIRLNRGGGGRFEDNNLRGSIHGAWDISAESATRTLRTSNTE